MWHWWICAEIIILQTIIFCELISLHYTRHYTHWFHLLFVYVNDAKIYLASRVNVCRPEKNSLQFSYTQHFSMSRHSLIWTQINSERPLPSAAPIMKTVSGSGPSSDFPMPLPICLRVSSREGSSRVGTFCGRMRFGTTNYAHANGFVAICREKSLPCTIYSNHSMQ